MTMDRVYNPHQQQHGFQQQAAAAQATAHHIHHHHHIHANQQQQQRYPQDLSSTPPTTASQPLPPPPPPTLVQQQSQPHHQSESFIHTTQQSRQHIYSSNQYNHQQQHLANHHHQNHLLQQQQHAHHHHHHNHEQTRQGGITTSSGPTQLLRPVHPPPPPPQPQQSLLVHQQTQSEPQEQRTHLFVPPMMASKMATNESRSNMGVNVMRNSLPVAPVRSAELSTDQAQRNSLQPSYNASTHYKYYQPSSLRRHPTHHNKYITNPQQSMQSIQTIHNPTSTGAGCINPSGDLQNCDSKVFDSGFNDHASQDMYTEKVIQAILAAKDALEKPIEERDEHDIMLIDNLCSLVHGFHAFTKNVRRALAAQTVLIVIDEKGKELIVHNEELDSFCVLIFGECEQLDETKSKVLRYYNVGDAFGVCEPTTESINFVGHMITRCENCAFLCVKRDDFYTILTDPANYPNKEIIRHRDKDGNVVCVSQFNIDRKSSGPLWSYHMQSKPFKIVFPDGHAIVKATESCLMAALVDGYERLDPDYVDDFLILYRVFMTWDIKDKEKKLPPGMIKLCLTMVKWLDCIDYRDRIVKVVLIWLSSYYHDFELNTEFSYLFFRLLESRLLSLGMNNQLHLLHVALTTQSKIRHVTISRSSREQPLAFSIAGGYEKNCGIFVTQVHGSSFDESPYDSLMAYLNYAPQANQEKSSLVGPVIPPRHKSLSNHHPLNMADASIRVAAQLKPGDQILEVNGTNFAAIKLQEAQKKLDMSTHLSLTVRYNPSAYHEMRALPEGRRKSSMSSLSSVSPYPQASQKFTFNLNEQLNYKNGSESFPPNSPLFSANANFGFRSLIKSAPKNDRSRLSNLINSSKQLVKQIRESTAQTNNIETSSKTSDNISDNQSAELDLGKVKSNTDIPNLKGKDKQIEYGLSNVVRSDDLNAGASAANGSNGSANQSLVNVLRVFNAANNDSRYLLIHPETTAREVVMVAVKEFNLTGGMNGSQGSPTEKSVSSLNWHLYEVSVVPESRTIKQKCLSEQTSRLAERASLCSRFYIKNSSQSAIGPSKLDMGDDSLVNEILKESPANITLTSLNATLLAVELTLTDFDKFRKIEPQQFVYDTFFDCSDAKEKQQKGSSSNGSISSHDSASLKSSSSDGQESGDVLHMLNKTRSVPKSWMQEYGQFADISNREMFWVICEILNERNIGRRVKIVKQFVRVADVCSQLRNYNSMFAIISGLGHSCVSRLRRTFEKLKPKYKNQLEKMRSLFDPSRNMLNYRNCLGQTQPPAIPLFPQIKKDLTFTKEGRSIFVRESNELSDDDDTGFSQDTIRRKTRPDLLTEKSNPAIINGTENKTHQLPVAQTRAISFTAFNSSRNNGPIAEGDSLLINFAEIRQFTERVRNVIYFSSVPYSSDLLTNTKDSQRNQAQIKKMHEEWQMRKRIRHYISETLGDLCDSGEPTANSGQSSSTQSGENLDQIDGLPASDRQSNNGKLIISYDERTLYQKSLEVEPEMNPRPQVVNNEPRHTATTVTATSGVSSALQATQSLQVHLPPPQVVPLLNIQQALQPMAAAAAAAANSSPTLSKSSSLSSCSSFSHHLPNYHAARGSSNLNSCVGKFGTESTESLRKLQALSENKDDWRSSSCNNNNNNQHHHPGSGNQQNNGLSRIASDGRVGLARNLVPSRIFPPKNGR